MTHGICTFLHTFFTFNTYNSQKTVKLKRFKRVLVGFMLPLNTIESNMILHHTFNISLLSIQTTQRIYSPWRYENLCTCHNTQKEPVKEKKGHNLFPVLCYCFFFVTIRTIISNMQKKINILLFHTPIK